MSGTLNFLVVDLPFVCNAILGHPCLTAFGAITSIPHLKMKFPTACGIDEMLGDQVIGKTYYMSQITPSDNIKVARKLDIEMNQPCNKHSLTPVDKPGIPTGVMVHKLSLDLDHSPSSRSGEATPWRNSLSSGRK
ncbi:hypothetical protein Nepgr_017334 [Nepenthes gracilis]|uniref:Uncharacterized protein n=1 Tax=Nepenthes gracilis TaxID=150966 RepID=A0AAD3XSD8_NEPGR|nr:hypothetical protein Nepgr_017334 [Nepenthes gracilis]